MQGFIKLHRKIELWEWYDDANTFRLFIHLILKASHTEINWHGITIERGQVIVGLNSLSKQLKLSPQQIRTSLSKLKSTNEITIKPTNKYSLVTLTQYDLYQSQDEKATNKTTSKSTNNQQTNNNQITTYKNVKNEKNKEEEKNIYRAFAHLKITDQEVDKLLADYTKEQIDDILDVIENSSINKKYTSLYLTAKNWLKKEPKKTQPPLLSKPEDYADFTEDRYINFYAKNFNKDSMSKSPTIQYWLQQHNKKLDDYEEYYKK